MLYTHILLLLVALTRGIATKYVFRIQNMLVNRQDFSLNCAYFQEKPALSAPDDLSWTAESLSFFTGLTYIGQAINNTCSWWVSYPQSKAYMVRNLESSRKSNVLNILNLQDIAQTPHTHLLCHLHDFEIKEKE